jgi:superfamily II DNA or RNA helicase
VHALYTREKVVPQFHTTLKPLRHNGKTVEQIFPHCSTVPQKKEERMELRPYQKECIETISALPPGSYLCQMATGLGKTVTFANIPRRGRELILSHREELVRQPQKYYSCTYGVEQAQERSHGEEVVSASVQSLVRRLDNFHPGDFDTIIVDEAHHAAAKTYRKILDYFKPRMVLGFTATPNRGDKVRLDNVFSKIVFSRDLRFGIREGYLTDIYCLRVNIGYDLRAVHTRQGDYAPGELDEAMEGTADAIAEAYRDYAKGPTLIFAVSVHHAEEIASKIPGAVAVTGKTADRASIIQQFTAGKIPALVNCMVFTEGPDIPRVETVIVARPTQSDSLYAQMVGRGLRLYPGKKRLTLIDCVGVTGKASLCTAPSLLGIDTDNIPERKRSELQGMIFDLPQKALAAMDCPESWIRNVEIVDLWAQEQKYQTHDVNWFKMPDGSMVCSLKDKENLILLPQDELGVTQILVGGARSEQMPMQNALDICYTWLCNHREEQRYIWDASQMKRWGKAPASEKQLAIIHKRCKGFDTTGLTKGQASQIMNRLLNGGRVL